MKILKGVLSFLIVFIFQIFVITLVEYLIFVSIPGIRQELIESLAGKSVHINHIISYLFIYVEWFGNILFRGDFGLLTSNGQPINQFIFYCTRLTLKLVVGGLLFSIVMSLGLILLKQKFSDSRIVKGLLSAIQILSSIHYIVLGYFVVVFWTAIRYDDSLWPLLVLAIGNSMLNDMMHLIEEEYQQIINSKYMRAARARGGNLFKNVLKPFAIALIRIVNSKFPMVLGGSFIIEFVLNIEGLGMQILRHGINGMNYNLLLIITMIITVFIIFVNTLTNYTQKILDPRPVR
ncbi:ABC-type transporter, integral membrane subunit [Caldithrix abyssi DSM 13497]|uniref:ABC-type dipeptide/oligopeptide/nickel transport system, permease component n=1 Tax=Caldithrix abyssi DSM 13497 TaxID=880073 RepID=H1XNW9_CALAY|nr:ABC transporter permease subunit [Caldithrix abyssi]APF19805.1 ABC-type dipeptide/oligopeptide/nickel transport system, permease component [Caldithrix abyssi DSM 13497]EHO39909.1 ABC-type transporter, integral membrane subunit [Caldithrix abyssi DSM 13497]